ncbi:hypothetical protein HN446_04875 [bacterium]|jgi:hypothetical protein|nr:hypothetical protein [bacterium]
MKSTITVFIHGTTPLEYLIFKPEFIKNFFSCPQGLVKATEINDNLHFKEVVSTLSKADSKHFPIENFYLFGWNGKLSFIERKQAAEKFKAELESLISSYDPETKVNLITHSHGGNIVLNMADCKKLNIKIDKLIMLACPVQEKTSHLINSDTFKTVYAIHSHADIIQVIDPQGIKELSEMINDGISNITLKKIPKPQMFFSHRHFKPSEKLRQIEVSFPRRRLTHLDFLLTRFLKQLPELIQNIDKSVYSGSSIDEIRMTLK